MILLIIPLLLNIMYSINLADFDDLPTSLSNAISAMKVRFPLLSVQALAKRLGIPNATFDRISKKEVKAPSFHHALTIAQEVCIGDATKIQKFIRKFYPEMISILDRWSELYDGRTDAHFLDKKVEDHLAHPLNYEIFFLVTSREGVSKETILNEYGKKGLNIIEEMLEDEFIEERENKYYANAKFNSGQEANWQCLQNLLRRNYWINDFGTGKNWLSVQWESVNPDYVVPRIREILMKTRQKINDLLDSPEGKGDKVIWVGTVMDCLTTYNINQQKDSE